ncbi:MAG: hypothetical protein L6416_09980 [Candidatus Omnitrophica bacterium]|nr:hypothetical protein [Candidatus Omnitrophota bacterium]
MMSQSFNFLRIIGKAVYLIGVLLFFNFFFGLLFFRFFYWILLGAILLFLFTGALTIGKNIIFTNFAKTKKTKGPTYRKGPEFQEGDVIDVEAQVVENEEPQD